MSTMPRIAGSTSQEMGARLYDAILPGSIRALFERSLEIRRERRERAFASKIFLNPRDESVRFLQGLPWELLFRKDRSEFLALSRSTPVVRSLAVPRVARTSQLSQKLRILAAELEATALDLASEIAGMESARERGSIEVVPWRARVSDLREMLDYHGPFDVLHFLGHGDFLPDCQEGALLFEKSGGGRELIAGARLAEKLRDFHLRLIVLNACKTAQSSGSPTGNPFGGVAASLVQAGFPAVLAMQEVVEDKSAIALSRALYRTLASKQPIEVALAEARQAVFDLNRSGLDWAIPCLFLRTSPTHGTPRHSPQEDHSPERLVQDGIDAFRAGNYSSARQMLARVPGSAEAQLFDTLARMVMGTPLPMKTILEIDRALQKLASAADPKIARKAQLALGILRYDVIEPRYLRTDGTSSSRLFTELERRGRPDALDREIAKALGASRGAIVRFKLQD